MVFVSRRIKNIILITSSILVFLFPLSGVSQYHLSFGVYASDKPSTMYETFEPVIRVLEQKMREVTGQPTTITVRVFKGYQEGIDRLSSGKVDFMRLGPASYILTKEQNPDVSLIAMEIRKGVKKFKGVIIVPESSEIAEVSQLKGKRFAFGNENSTIGRYLAQAELIDAGIYGRDLSAYDYLGRHDNVAAAVGVHRYDAGSVKEKTFHKMKEEHKLKAIAYFDNVTKPWVAREGLDQYLIDSLRKALILIQDKTALKKLKVDAFSSVQDSDYNFVREGMLKARDF